MPLLFLTYLQSIFFKTQLPSPDSLVLMPMTLSGGWIILTICLILSVVSFSGLRLLVKMKLAAVPLMGHQGNLWPSIRWKLILLEKNGFQHLVWVIIITLPKQSTVIIYYYYYCLQHYFKFSHVTYRDLWVFFYFFPFYSLCMVI